MQSSNSVLLIPHFQIPTIPGEWLVQATKQVDSNPDKQGAYREAVLDLRVGGHDGGGRLAVRLPLRNGSILGLRLRLRRRRFGVTRVGAESRPPPQKHRAAAAPQRPQDPEQRGPELRGRRHGRCGRCGGEPRREDGGGSRRRAQHVDAGGLAA